MQTGAKVIIRGKGSVKEGKIGRKDGMPLPGEDDELHAYITATSMESVAKALEKINTIIKEGIEVPEAQNDLRKQQLRELALLNGTLRESEGLAKLRQLAEASEIVTNTIICAQCGGAGHVASDCKERRPGESLRGMHGGSTSAAGDGSSDSGQGVPQERQKMDSEYLALMSELGVQQGGPNDIGLSSAMSGSGTGNSSSTSVSGNVTSTNGTTTSGPPTGGAYGRGGTPGGPPGPRPNVGPGAWGPPPPPMPCLPGAPMPMPPPGAPMMGPNRPPWMTPPSTSSSGDGDIRPPSLMSLQVRLFIVLFFILQYIYVFCREGSQNPIHSHHGPCCHLLRVALSQVVGPCHRHLDHHLDLSSGFNSVVEVHPTDLVVVVHLAPHLEEVVL